MTKGSIKENKNKGTKSFKIKGYHFTLLLILAISFLIFCKQLNFFFFCKIKRQRDARTFLRPN
jgi:hypothetical protein